MIKKLNHDSGGRTSLNIPRSIRRKQLEQRKAKKRHQEKRRESERERERINRGLKNDNTKTNIGATNVTNADQIEELRHYQQLQ